MQFTLVKLLGIAVLALFSFQGTLAQRKFLNILVLNYFDTSIFYLVGGEVEIDTPLGSGKFGGEMST